MELQAARRTPGIKIFIGSSTGNLLVDDQEALERIFAETTLPITAHCEDETTVRANTARFAGTHDVADHSRIRDEQAAVIATRRAIDLAVRHQHRFHVLHVSTAAEARLLVENHKLITAEACPHHLLFNVDDYPRLGTLDSDEPVAEDRRRQPGIVAGLAGWPHPGDRDRSRASHARRKAAALSGIARRDCRLWRIRWR